MQERGDARAADAGFTVVALDGGEAAPTDADPAAAADVNTADDELVIEVIDEGPGIPADALERVFDKFYRVRQGDRQRAGTGLGLPLAKAMMELHGGSLSIISEPGNGTAVMLVFPDTQTQINRAERAA